MLSCQKERGSRSWSQQGGGGWDMTWCLALCKLEASASSSNMGKAKDTVLPPRAQSDLGFQTFKCINQMSLSQMLGLYSFPIKALNDQANPTCSVENSIFSAALIINSWAKLQFFSYLQFQKKVSLSDGKEILWLSNIYLNHSLSLSLSFSNITTSPEPLNVCVTTSISIFPSINIPSQADH